MGPPDKDGADMKNYLSGEISGINTAKGVLQTLHTTAVDMIATIKSEQEKLEPEQETRDGAQEG